MFKDKVMVITGGSSGLGRVLAGRFAGMGAHLALVARDMGKLEAVSKEISAGLPAGRKIGVFSCNVADPASVQTTFAAIAKEIGAPDILINSAGILHEGYFEKQSNDKFREIMDINFFGTLNCVRAVLPHMKKKGGGRIVNISSMAGLMGAFGYSAYCSSKYALVGLTDTLRHELKPMNIKVQLACPGEFESPMVDALNTYRTGENRVLVHTLPVLDAETVADVIISGIERDKYMIIPGFVARVIERVNRHFPGLARAIADYRLKKVYRGPDGRNAS
jgi:3-dehydrosphinganine reductase